MSHTIRFLPLALCLGATVCGTTSTASREPAPTDPMQSSASADSQADTATATEAAETDTEATPGTPSEAASSSSAAAAAPPDPGLVMIDSHDGFQKTVQRARGAILKHKLKLESQLDHHKKAQTVKMKIPPTRTFIFNDAKASATLIEAQPSVAIDLPMKLVVFEDGDGKVHILYNDPQWLVRRHKISGQDEVIAGMKTTLDEIATAAMGKEKPPEEDKAKGKKDAKAKDDKGAKKGGGDKAPAKSGGDKDAKKADPAKGAGDKKAKKDG